MREKPQSGLDRFPAGVGDLLREHCAIYAIGPERGKPLKVGIASNITERFGNLQCSHWVQLRIHHVVWSHGRLTAERIEREAHRILDVAKTRIRGEWFSITPELAHKLIATAAGNLGLRIWTHAEMVARVTDRERRMLERELCEAFGPRFGIDRNEKAA